MRTPARCAAAALCAAVLVASPALADDGSASKQASKHFQRAVSLYGEADYRAALVEFKRAYALAPNPAVLYNVGEAQYQLQDYAGALTTFEHFLAEAPPGDAHRAEVEGDLDVLRARVGHVSVTTIPPGADLSVDDQPSGRTPLERALLVSIGRRKLVASLGGRPPVTRYVDVAADDNLTVTLQLPDSAEPQATPTPRSETAPHPLDAAETSGGGTLRVVGWTGTAALGVSAITFGILAVRQSHDLETDRASFPTTSPTLTHDAQLTSTYSILADSLGAAAVVLGGVTLLSTWLSAPAGARVRTGSGGTRLLLGPGSARVVTTF